MENLENNQSEVKETQQTNSQIAPSGNPGPINSMGEPVSSKHLMIGIVVALIGVLIAVTAGGIYAYIMKVGPFSIAPYSQENLLSGILESVSKINSSSYSVSASLSMTEREKGAYPFTTKLSNAEERKKQYQNDYIRTEDASDIVMRLAAYARNYKGLYPASLKILIAEKGGYYGNSSIKDPVTQQDYIYSTSDAGKNFSLNITFETDEAISAIKSSLKYYGSDRIVGGSGKNLIFTKDSGSYFYIPREQAKPFLETLSEYSEYFPPEFNISSTINALADWSNKDSVDWKINLDATGDYGDLTYKVNVDALKKINDYYFKINNIPGFILGYMPFSKGEWIRVDPTKTSEETLYLSKGLPEAEKYYKEHREEVADLLKKIIKIADQEKIFTLKNSPKAEKVNGRQLYRYDLEINKEAIVPFYKGIQEEFKNSNINNDYPILLDNTYVEYLQSPEFNEVFDYYQKNTNLTLWVDSLGSPALVSYGMRIIPADSVTKLKDKQANLVLQLELSNINKKVDIDAPTDYKNIEDLTKVNPDVVY